jgi:hypothetical protein
MGWMRHLATRINASGAIGATSGTAGKAVPIDHTRDIARSFFSVYRNSEPAALKQPYRTEEQKPDQGGRA